MDNKKFRLALIPLALWGSHLPAAYATSDFSDIEVKATSSENATASTDVKTTEKKKNKKEKTDTNVAEEHIEVTGTRLQNGDITSRQLIITEQDIKARGVSSVEDLIRTLPQNLATIGTITNERTKGPLSNRGKTAVSALGSLGVSAANLGGMGAGQTLVLVNGRRLAGAAGIEDGFVNLNGIPLTAIERVEISLDGASAVYGSDAMGGVINFILKKGFSGSTISVQHLDSENNANKDRISLYSGYAWTSGSVSGTVEYTKQKPINNWKSGYTTENYSSYYDGDSTYDFRSLSNGAQPGVIVTPVYQYDGEGNYIGTIEQGLSLPAGFTGKPTIDDMVTVGSEVMRDYVPEKAGPDADTMSVTLNFDQRLTEHLSFYANGLYTRAKNSQEYQYTSGLTVQLAPGQYYNPYPAYYFSSYNPGTTVAYYPQAELDAGLLPQGRIQNTNINWSLNTGFTYEFNEDTKLDFVYTTSASTSKGQRWNFNSVVSLIADTNSPSGVSCYNYDLTSGLVTGADRDRLQQAFDQQCIDLTSSDPNVAFNPWNASANAAGANINDFFFLQEEEQRSSGLKNYELRLNGSLYQLPAGKVFYAFGGEYNDDGVSSNEVKVKTGEAVDRDKYALFGELNLPVFGGDYTVLGAKQLTLKVAARRDIYKTKGAVGTVDGTPVDQGGELVMGKNTFARTTPSYSFYWEPINGISLRGKWSKGFQAPPFTQLFDVAGTTTYSTIIFNDPLYDCSAHNDCDYQYSANSYYAPMKMAPNPDLKPQTSTQKSLMLSLFPSGLLNGLNLDVTWNKTERRNEFAKLQDMYYLLPQSEVYKLPQYFTRDSSGKIIQANTLTTNISGSTFESMTYELRYNLDTAFGSFAPQVTYLRNIKSEQKAFEDSTPISTIGKLQGVDKYKITSSLRYDYQDFTATLWMYYTPSYINDYEQNMYAGVIDRPEYAKEVGSMTTFDLTMGYQLTNALRVNFAGRNIFDRDPAFVVVQGRPYDTARYDAAGRTLSLELQYDF